MVPGGHRDRVWSDRAPVNAIRLWEAEARRRPREVDRGQPDEHAREPWRQLAFVAHTSDE